LTSQNEGDLKILADGDLLCFPAVWLRDNCPCPDCLDPVSGQKLKDITELPDGLAVSAAADAGDTVAVTYAPDGHQSVFSRAWLAGHALDGHDLGQDRDGRTEDDGQELWRPADLARRPEASWPQYLAAPAERARALAAVLRWGFLLLRDVPAEPGLVLDVAAGFGFVRETNYGRRFDVRAEPRPGNRSAQPMRRPYAQVTAFYVAYARWAALLARPERQLNLRLAPGDCLIFDNTRILHARTAFSGTGGRHLQGCYADLDGLASTLAILRREIPGLPDGGPASTQQETL